MSTEFSVNSKKVNLIGFASSMSGGRPENQDDLGFLDTPLGFLFVLCDGMGGGPAGKMASDIVKREIAASINSCNSLTPPDQALREAFVRANNAIEKKISGDSSLKGMGSTAVAFIIGKQSAYVAHTGDSRFYHLRKGQLVWRTTDHSIVSELVQMKALTEEQARTSPQSNVITRGLGATNNHTPDITEISYEAGDRFVICSDGVWGMFPARELIFKLVQNGNIDSIVKMLQDEIDNIGKRQGGKHDNHSIVIIEVNGYSQKKIIMIKRLIKAIVFLSVLCGILFILNIFSTIRIRNLSIADGEDDAVRELSMEEKLEGCYNRIDSLNETLWGTKNMIEKQKDTIKELRKELIILKEEFKKNNSQKEGVTAPLQALSSKNDSIYVVKPGDILSKIAQSYGTTVKEIMKLNNMKSDSIQPGQKIRVK